MNPNILALQNNIPKCPICLGPINNPIKSNNCLHLFCEVCLTMWLQRKNECPICRKAIDNTTKLYYPKNLKLKNNKLNSLNYSIENLKMDNFGNYSKKCLVCGENNQESEFILCDYCHYFITHFHCDPPNGLIFGKYYCRFCRKKFIESIKSSK